MTAVTLLRDLHTPIGTYAAGTPVEVAYRTDTGIVARLPRAHPTAISWTIDLKGGTA